MSDTKTLPIFSDKQLFLDDYIIDRLEDVSRKLNQPLKDPGNPLVVRDRPWEGMLIMHGSVLYDRDERIYKMWYQDILKEFISASLPSSNVAICYATSPDGVHWEKPELGVYDYHGEHDNNIVWMPPASYPTPWMEPGSIIKDEAEPDPEKRYKTANWIYFFREYNHDYGPNFYVSTSPDGIHWHGLTNIVDLPSGDAGYISYDRNTGKYVGITRSYPNLPGFDATWMRARTICWSDDLKTWTRPQLILAPDEHDSPDTQYYKLSMQAYEGVYIGVLAIFRTEAQTIDQQLVTSRDGRIWSHVADRATFLPLGPAGSWDSKMIMTVAQPPFVIKDDTIAIYFDGDDLRHDAAMRNVGTTGSDRSIGRATLRRDGFCSLDAGSREGTFTSKPFLFTGNALVINARTSGDGYVAAEILDAAGNVIEGLSRSFCYEFRGDEVRHVVAWKANPEGRVEGKIAYLARSAMAWGREIRLRLYLRQAKLYSFQFV